MMTRVLVAGANGREFTLGQAFAAEGAEVHFMNGNGACRAPYVQATNHEIPHTATRFGQLAYDLDVDLGMVGSENDLNAGFIDGLHEVGVLGFGPTKEQAKLETSKDEGMQFCKDNNLPCPDFETFENIDDAIDHIQDKDPTSYVIKADGLAGGKGVFLPDSEEEARGVLRELMIDGKYNGSGLEKVVIAERLHGPEVSLQIVLDGKGGYSVLPYVQDHKRIDIGDTGPNTGGVGAYAPIQELFSKDQVEKIYKLAGNIVAAMQASGRSYPGIIYAGLMMAEEFGGDPAIIEFNTRWGDPETQVIVPLLMDQGVSLLQMHLEAVKGELTLPQNLTKASKSAISFILCKAGYPNNLSMLDPRIRNLNRLSSDVILQFAGVLADQFGLYAHKGRVLAVTALGETIDEAAANALNSIGQENGGIYFDGMYYRRDIAWQLRKMNESS